MAHWNGLQVLAAIFISIIILFSLFHLLQKSKKQKQKKYVMKLARTNEKEFFETEEHVSDDGILSPVRIIPTNASLYNASKEVSPDTHAHLPAVLSLYIKARTDHLFYGYELLQAILNQGFVHGAMNFFHYNNGQKTLFTLTSSEPPGSFDLDQMGNFNTSGLCIFMQPRRFANPSPIFDKMLAVAQHIAEDLDGVLEDEHHHLLTPQRTNYWRAFLTDLPHHG